MKIYWTRANKVNCVLSTCKIIGLFGLCTGYVGLYAYITYVRIISYENNANIAIQIKYCFVFILILPGVYRSNIALFKMTCKTEYDIPLPSKRISVVMI